MATQRSKPVDMELKKQEMSISDSSQESSSSLASRTLDLIFRAFQELQTKMIQTSQQLKISDVQIDSLKRQIAHTKLVDQEIASLPTGTNTYEGVGRMFILQPIPEVQKNLQTKRTTAEEKIKSIETNKTYLEQNMKESEDNLRELVMSKQRK